MSNIKSSKLFTDHRWWVWMMLILALFFGLIGRFYDLDDPPLDFHPTRQLHSLIIARGIYYEKLEDAPEWQRSLAVRFWKAEGNIEPPLMEHMAVVGYQLVGYEDLRIPRLLSIFFYMFGAVGLFLLLSDLVGEKGAVIGLAYYLVLPFAVIASRSFQPDPLMIAAMIWSWWGTYHWVRKKSWTSAIIAGLLSGFAIFVKSHAVFFVIPVILVAIFVDRRFREIVIDPQVWTLGILTILPYFIYNFEGLFISGSLRGHHGFYPNLLLNPFHFLKWKNLIDKVLGIEFFLIGLFGTLTIKDKKFRMMFFSVFIGYLVYGLVFAYHMVSHDYYQVPLTPAIAIGLSAAVAVLIENLRGNKVGPLIILGGLLFFWMSVNFWDTRMALKHARYHDEPTFYADLGEKIRDYSVVSITPDYGFRLSYWGWAQSTNWLSEGDFYVRELAGRAVDKEVQLANAIKDNDLFLVTDFDEFERQTDIRTYLMDNYTIFDESEKYIIFDLRNPLSSTQ